jgi:hypothetical protein
MVPYPLLYVVSTLKQVINFAYLLIAQSLSTDLSKISCPESCFFFDHKTVPLYRTHVLCTQGHCNILLIGWTEVGSLSVFQWADT